MKLRFAPTTEQFIQNYSKAVPHALLLAGPVGVGLNTLAGHIARSNGTILTVVKPESKSSALPSITVERIRELYEQTRSRLHGLNFVVIDDADTMNQQAQNALLKLLEEPNQSIRFILTAHNPSKLLPTVRSRTQTFSVPKIDAVSSKRLLATGKELDDITTQRLLFVAEGLPAELERLASSKKDFTAISDRVQSARRIIEGGHYERLAFAVSYSGDRQEAIQLLDMVTKLLRRSLSQNPEQSTVKFIDRILEASVAIRANGNVKLHLAAAMV